MANTKKRKKKKGRGTQGGSVGKARRRRPANRQEAQARARSRSGGQKRTTVDRRDIPPTWRSAANRAFIAASIFGLIMYFAFGRSLGQSAVLALFMFGIYVPMGYYTDNFFYRRRKMALVREKQAAAEAKRARRGK